MEMGNSTRGTLRPHRTGTRHHPVCVCQPSPSPAAKCLQCQGRASASGTANDQALLAETFNLVSASFMSLAINFEARQWLMGGICSAVPARPLSAPLRWGRPAAWGGGRQDPASLAVRGGKNKTQPKKRYFFPTSRSELGLSHSDWCISGGIVISSHSW